MANKSGRGWIVVLSGKASGGGSASIAGNKGQGGGGGGAMDDRGAGLFEGIRYDVSGAFLETRRAESFLEHWGFLAARFFRTPTGFRSWCPSSGSPG